jgi:hypothetical protein
MDGSRTIMSWQRGRAMKAPPKAITRRLAMRLQGRQLVELPGRRPVPAQRETRFDARKQDQLSSSVSRPYRSRHSSAQEQTNPDKKVA